LLRATNAYTCGAPSFTGIHPAGDFFLFKNVRVAANLGVEIALDVFAAEEITKCAEDLSHRHHS
jgi:hypothetical protein